MDLAQQQDLSLDDAGAGQQLMQQQQQIDAPPYEGGEILAEDSPLLLDDTSMSFDTGSTAPGEQSFGASPRGPSSQQQRPEARSSMRQPPSSQSSLQDLRTLRVNSAGGSGEFKRAPAAAGFGARQEPQQARRTTIGASGGSTNYPTERPRVQPVEGFAEASMSTLTAIDKVQHALVKGAITIMSPAFTAQSCLPSFMKRPFDLQQAFADVAGVGNGDGNGASSSNRGGMSLIPESGKETHRTLAMDKLTSLVQKNLTGIQEKLIRTLDMVKGSSIGFQPAAPEIGEIATVSRTHFSQNRTISSRLEIIDGLLKDTIQNARSFWFRQDTLCQGAIATFRSLSDTVLTNTYSLIARLAHVMQQYFDKEFVTKIQKYQADWDREKRAALDRQAQLHYSMYKLIEKQHTFAQQLLYLLRNQAHQLPQRERTKAEARLRELTANAHSLFVEARVYYQQAHLSLTLEPLSPILFERVQKWLIDVQLVLIEMLMPMTLSSAAMLSAASSAGDSKRSSSLAGGATAASQRGTASASAVVAGSPAAMTSLASKSVLYQFAQRTESGRLSDKAAALLMEPKGEVVSDVLQSFVHFYHDQSERSRAAAQQNVNRLNASLHTLQQKVMQAQKLRDEHFARHPSQNQQAQQQPSGLSGLTASASAAAVGVGGGVIPSTRSAETVRMLLHMNTDLKAMEKRLAETYKELFESAQPELLRFQEQQNETVHVVGYLRDFKALNREWDSLIKSEMDHCSTWFAKSLAQSRFVTDEFLGWNHFVTAQIDNLGVTIDLFATNLFYQMQQLVFDWVSMHVQSAQTRQSEFETELQLIETQVDGLREHDQINLADRVSRLIQQVREWVESNNFAKLATCQSGWLADFERHIVCLQQLADKWSSDSFEGDTKSAVPREPLLAFLHTLDIMYETTDFGVQATVDRQLQEQESKRVAYSTQKLAPTSHNATAMSSARTMMPAASTASATSAGRSAAQRTGRPPQQVRFAPSSTSSTVVATTRATAVPASARTVPSSSTASISAQASRPVQGQRTAAVLASGGKARPASAPPPSTAVISAAALRTLSSEAATAAVAATSMTHSQTHSQQPRSGSVKRASGSSVPSSNQQKLFGGGASSSKPSSVKKPLLIQDQLKQLQSGGGGAMAPGSQRFV